MQTVDRAEHAVLDMPHVQLVTLFPKIMPADIVAPPRIPYVRRRRREIRQIPQRVPRDLRIPRKPERVSMRTHTRVSRQQERCGMPRRIIQIMIMIKRPKWIVIFLRAVLLRFLPRNIRLLPIDPPKIDAVFFVRTMQHRKIRVDKFCARKIKGNLLAV